MTTPKRGDRVSLFVPEAVYDHHYGGGWHRVNADGGNAVVPPSAKITVLGPPLPEDRDGTMATYYDGGTVRFLYRGHHVYDGTGNFIARTWAEAAEKCGPLTEVVIKHPEATP